MQLAVLRETRVSTMGAVVELSICAIAPIAASMLAFEREREFVR